MAVNPIPEGYHTLTPFLVAEGAAELLDFLVQGLGGELKFRMDGPDGTVAHAEVQVGDSMIMVSSGGGEYPPTQAGYHLYVPDADAWFKRAVDAGAAVVHEPKNEFYGDRTGQVRDRWGNWWSFATHVEDVSEEEMERRMTAAGSGS
jgi:PhnB protein